MGNSLIVFVGRFCLACGDDEGCVEYIYIYIPEWFSIGLIMGWTEALGWTKLGSNMAAKGAGIKISFCFALLLSLVAQV